MKRSARSRIGFLLAGVSAGLLAACNGSEKGGVAGAESTPAAPPAATTQEVWIDEIYVPTLDEAYDQVQGEITEENIDEEFQRLMEEIEGDD